MLHYHGLSSTPLAGSLVGSDVTPQNQLPAAPASISKVTSGPPGLVPSPELRSHHEGSHRFDDYKVAPAMVVEAKTVDPKVAEPKAAEPEPIEQTTGPTELPLRDDLFEAFTKAEQRHGAARKDSEDASLLTVESGSESEDDEGEHEEDDEDKVEVRSEKLGYQE